MKLPSTACTLGILLTIALAYALAPTSGLASAPAWPHAVVPDPASGVALACVLVWGRRNRAGVILGLLLALLGSAHWHQGLPGWTAGLGVLVQTLAAVWLVRRCVPQPLSLRTPRDVIAFLLLAGPVAGLLGAIVSVAVRTALAGADVGADVGVDTATLCAQTGLLWAGRSVGVCIGAPVALSLLGRPRRDWAPRRLAVGLPLALVALLWDLALRPGGPAAGSDASGLMLVALVCTCVLAAVLLISSAQARRVEALVAERTVQWELQVQERLRVENALRETEQRLRSIFDNIPVGLRYTDRHGNFLEVNPAYCAITGYSAEELRGLDVWKLTHPDDRVAEGGHFAGLFSSGVPVVEREKRYIHKSGEIRWVRISLRLLGDPHHADAKTVGVVEEVTERLRLQDVERARRTAEAANRAKSEFLSRMSHELRTPLNAILGFSQLMDMDRLHPLPAQQAQWNAQLQTAGWHLLRMIDDVLDFSRIDTGHLRLTPAALDVGAVLAEARSLVTQAAAQRGLQVVEPVGPQAARVLGDATRVKQILTNLLSNAVKYNRPGGSIHVGVHAPDDQFLAISVQDTGLGMTSEQLSHLFQPFNRLGRENSGVEGNGIGLVIARRLAELMGGSLTATSAPGRGSTFTLRLPRAADDAPREAEPLPAYARDAAYPLRRVHYIEDNEVNAEVMRGILLQRPQVTLGVSPTGGEGLAVIRRDLPSLVLLDMNLPDMDGLQVLGELQRHEPTAGIPVVVVSADTTEELIVTAIRAGATHVLCKPVHVPELLKVLDECLEGQPAVVSDAIAQRLPLAGLPVEGAAAGS